MEGMPNGWRSWDRSILRATEIMLFVIGAAFTCVVTLEVISRFLLNFSIYFTNAMARYLLVWFFVLGAGPALRRGAHVGFDMLVRAVPPSIRTKIETLAHALVLCFFALMIWSGVAILPQAASEVDTTLGISSIWVMLAFPIGFTLLFYHHTIVMFERRGGILPGRSA